MVSALGMVHSLDTPETVFPGTGLSGNHSHPGRHFPAAIAKQFGMRPQWAKKSMLCGAESPPFPLLRAAAVGERREDVHYSFF